MCDDILFDLDDIMYDLISSVRSSLRNYAPSLVFQAANLLIYTKKDSMDVKVASGNIKRRCEV